MIEEFKKFAMRGNVMDLAVGVVIGGAFGKIVSSLVDDIIMPLVSIITGGIDFSDKVWVLRKTAEGVAELSLKYGSFIQSIIDFVIIAFAIFITIKQMNRIMPKDEQPVAPIERECSMCCSSVPIKASKCRHCGSELK